MKKQKKCIVIYTEGETEEEFYNLILDKTKEKYKIRYPFWYTRFARSNNFFIFSTPFFPDTLFTFFIFKNLQIPSMSYRNTSSVKGG